MGKRRGANKMFCINVLVPVELEDGGLYNTMEEAEEEKAHLDGMDAGNIYEIEEVK
jgi:hypothetical protein